MYSEETWPSAALSTTNPTRFDPARTRAVAIGRQRLSPCLSRCLYEVLIPYLVRSMFLILESTAPGESEPT
jgi:hypothetical protein